MVLYLEIVSKSIFIFWKIKIVEKINYQGYLGVGNSYVTYHQRKSPLYTRTNYLIYIYYKNIQNRLFRSLNQKKFDLNIFISDGATGISKICQPIFLICIFYFPYIFHYVLKFSFNVILFVRYFISFCIITLSPL